MIFVLIEIIFELQDKNYASFTSLQCLNINYLDLFYKSHIIAVLSLELESNYLQS